LACKHDDFRGHRVRISYQEHIDTFITCLDEERYFDAHEALEEVWFPRRMENDVQMNLIKGFINAAVSFELTKRGRPESASKVWKNYEKYIPLIDTFQSVNTPSYRALALKVEALRDIKSQ